MRNLKKMALVVAATGGLLFTGAGVSAASTAPQGETAGTAPQGETAAAPQGEANHTAHKGEGDSIPVISNFKELDWEDSPFCGTQIKTKDSKQESYCPVAHLENSPDSTVVIITD